MGQDGPTAKLRHPSTKPGWRMLGFAKLAWQMLGFAKLALQMLGFTTLCLADAGIRQGCFRQALGSNQAAAQINLDRATQPAQ